MWIANEWGGKGSAVTDNVLGRYFRCISCYCMKHSHQFHSTLPLWSIHSFWRNIQSKIFRLRKRSEQFTFNLKHCGSHQVCLPEYLYHCRWFVSIVLCLKCVWIFELLIWVFASFSPLGSLFNGLKWRNDLCAGERNKRDTHLLKWLRRVTWVKLNGSR